MKSAAPLPIGGVANDTTLFDTAGFVTSPERMRNIRAFDTHLDRPRLGKRPGLVRAFGERVGPGAGQGCGVVSRARVATGYAYGDSTPMTSSTWVGRTSGGLDGHAWMLTPEFGLIWDYIENISSGGPYGDSFPGVSTQPVNAVAVSPDGTKVAIACNYVDGSTRMVTRITCLSVLTGQRLWSTKVTSGSGNRFTDALVFSSDWVFACSNQYVEAFAVADGTRATPFTNSWASLVIAASLTTDGHVFVAFEGSSGGATLNSGATVSAGKYAAHFRSGVMKLKINPAGSSSALTQVPFAPQLATSARFFEGTVTPYQPHNYCRFSEQFPWAPRGCLPTGIATMPDGGFVVSHTNTGWGPNSSNVSPDYVPPTGPYATISRFGPDGTHYWSVDTFSDTSTGDGSLPNDIPTGGGDDPTLNAITADAGGTIFAGGKRLTGAAGTNSVYCVSPSGVLEWTQDTGSVVRQNGIAVVPGTQGWVVVAGDRNNSWPGASGANAHLWRLSRETGVIQKVYDTGENGSALGVAFTPAGNIVYVTDRLI